MTRGPPDAPESGVPIGRILVGVMGGLYMLLGIGGVFGSPEHLLGILLLIFGALMLWRALHEPEHRAAEIRRAEREELLSVAQGAVAWCPACGWLSYNGVITECAQCGGPLQKIPPRTMS